MDERIRARLHKYAYDLTLDPNTANKHLILSEGNKKVTHVRECQSYPDHLERFECPQVLSRESLNAKSGCCYWEAECSGVDFDIAVTYKGIPRKKRFRGNEFKFNENTWSLNCFHNHFTVWEGYVSTEIHVPSGYFNRVGVYVDVSAGTLSFYSISDTHTLTHIRTFNTTFNEPLYAGFRVCDESSVSLCDIN